MYLLYVRTIHSFLRGTYLGFGGTKIFCALRELDWDWEEGDIHPYLPKVEPCRDEKRFCCTKNDCFGRCKKSERAIAAAVGSEEGGTDGCPE